MHGKTHENIKDQFDRLKDGVIADFEAAEHMINRNDQK